MYIPFLFTFSFRTTLLFNGSGGVTNATTATIRGATVHTEGVIDVDSNILPGHESVSIVKVTATGNNELIPYNLVWNGTNTFSKLDYKVYKTTTRQNVTTTCNTEKTVIDGAQVIGEVCNITNLDKIGNSINEGTIIKDDTNKVLTKDEFITATSDGSEVYYYIVIEYENLDISQNDDLRASINGKIKVEESNAKADINIVAAYIKQEDGTYEETSDIPQSGYALNKEKSTCSNGATPTWVAPNITVNNLTKSGTSCYLYFDKYVPTLSEHLLAYAKENTNGEKDSFSTVATTNEGIFEASDGMYGGTSYYWRGAVTDNHVIFANYCWRIIRINGDGTIRMIYNGAVQSDNTCLGNGANTTNVEIEKGAFHNTENNQSYYVGWTYSSNSQRPSESINNGSIGTANTIKSTVDTWYNSNIENNATYNNLVASGKYCNDRNTGTPPSSWSSWATTTTWSATGSGFVYAATGRLHAENHTPAPTLSCGNNGDTYQVKVGLITADEVSYAGGLHYTGNNYENTSYYLCNGSGYWTMSPNYWIGNDNHAYVFVVNSNGYLNAYNGYVSNNTIGVRPVINLSTDAIFKEGTNGTKDLPYQVIQ